MMTAMMIDGCADFSEARVTVTCSMTVKQLTRKVFASLRVPSAKCTVSHEGHDLWGDQLLNDCDLAGDEVVHFKV